MSSVLLGTKLRSPGLRPGMVARPRLMELPEPGTGTVVVVVAPPGFGKSMLLAQWEQHDDRPLAWVSLDARDNDPLLLWNYLVAAIRRIEPEFAELLEPELTSAGGTVFDDLIPRVLNEIENLDREIVAVLDDYHVITNAACHETIAFLIERGPANLQVVIASRQDPPLPLGRLRAGGGLFELRAADLAFTKAETAELFGGTFGLDLDAAAITSLHRRTEGWPAALYLAYLSVRGTPDPAAALAGFGGSSRHLVEYLTEVVLESETEEHRSFLLETSILERVCAPLCDSVTGRKDSARMLEEIEHANLFLVPLDERREWFRYHHLFADLLGELRRRGLEAAIENDRHRRACAWYTAAGYVDDAVDHAIAGSDLDTASKLIGTHWPEYLNSGRIATITRWLAAFPKHVVRGDAQLCIVKAWMLGLAGSDEEARQALDAAEESDYDGELPDGSGTVSQSVTLVRASFPWSGADATLAAARSAYETEATRKSEWQALAAFDLGYALFLRGDTEEAVEPLEEALALAVHHQQWAVGGDTLCILAATALAAGDLDQAERWIGEALELARTHGFISLPHVGFYLATLGEVQARKGLFELADESFGLGLVQMKGYWDSLLITNALLGRALVLRSLGRRAEAREILAEARAEIEGFPDPGVVAERIDEVSRKLAAGTARSDPYSDLTERELEVLRLLADGLTKREAAGKLFVSYSTVHSHTKSIYRKLDGASRDEVLERAQELGLLGG